MIPAALLTLLVVASILLAWIDLRRGVIPDWLNLSIALLGLGRALLLDGWEGTLAAALEGLAVGAVVWLLRWLYFVARKRQGLGLGDVKLLAASAIWIGAVGVPLQLLVGSLTALAAAAALHLSGRTMTGQTVLPFGPFLVLGLLAALTLQQYGWFI